MTVTLELAKAQCRIQHADEDDVLAGYITAAGAWVERYSRRIDDPRTIVDKFNAFGDHLELSRSPVIEVTEIAYTDADGDAQTVTGFRVRGGKVYPPTAGWPTIEIYSTIRVTFQAGYAVSSEYPPELIVAQLMIIASLYDDREGTLAALALGVPPAIAHLVVPFRQGGYA